MVINNNKQKHNLVQAKYREKNKQKCLERTSKWKKENKDAIEKYSKNYYLDNKEYFKKSNKEWSKNNKEARKKLNLKNRYGITLEQYNNMKILQDNRCCICSDKLEAGRKSNLDHCHSTGTIRGILCWRCNTLLGQARDNILILKSAISYLEKWNTKK